MFWRSSKKSTPAKTAPKKKKSAAVFPKILTAEGWRRMMMKRKAKKK